MITFQNVTKSYKYHQVIKSLNFTINSGEIVALIGGNGVGKSTTISMMLGILKPTSGEP